MNVTLWVLQIVLAIHTVIGAVWKFSNSEQAVPSLKAIGSGVWRSLSVVEILIALALILPGFTAAPKVLVPIAALVIVAEMLLFTGVHLASAEKNSGEMIYWLVVAAVCAFVALGRWIWSPL